MCAFVSVQNTHARIRVVEIVLGMWGEQLQESCVMTVYVKCFNYANGVTFISVLL